MSNKLWVFTLAFGALLPFQVVAQEEVVPVDAAAAPAADESTAAPAESAPAADEAAAAPAEAPAAEEAALQESAEASGAEPPVEETAPEEPVGEREPFEFYAGADRSRMTLQISDDQLKQDFDPAAAASPRSDYSSYFYTLRAGIRLFHSIGLEGQYGIKDDSGDDSGQVEVKDFFAFYLVPTATVLNLFELSARVGYASFETANSNSSTGSDGVSFGVGAEFPLKRYLESLPDIRLTSGVTVWHVGEESRSYGFHYGLRYDFKI